MEVTLQVTGNPSKLVAVDDPSAVGEARRLSQRLVSDLGFGATDAGRVALVVVELATNILKHAGHGAIVFRMVESSGRSGVEVLALDSGPGMHNVNACLRDGYSTAGSPGTGLGAISRLADTFEIYSGPEVSTAVLARLFAGERKEDVTEHIHVGAVCVPVRGESHPGDGWAVEDRHSPAYVLVADGLGHGPSAAKAAEAALTVFQNKKNDERPESILARAHGALRATRGAAVSIASLDFDKRVVHYAGVGNVAARIVEPGSNNSRSLVSQNGTVGVEMRKVQEFSYPWSESAVLIVHTDGIGTRWDLSRYPGLLARDPALVAGVLYRDYRRNSDDATVVVVRRATVH